MSILIGQISYLPPNELRTKRLQVARFQIEWFNKILPNTKIISVAQRYDLHDYMNGVQYFEYENGIGAGAARNIILKEFYNSDYDWLLLCDDDTIIDDKYYPEYFIKELVNNREKFKDVHAISALEPEYHPYKLLNFKDKGNLTHYKFEPRELNSGSATSFIQNVKKFYGKELYYPNVDASKGEGREDMEFLFSWLKSGLNWYTMQTLIRKSLCFDKSSIFGDDTKARDKILMHDLDVICDRYKEDGLMRDINGKISWKNFNERYNTSKKVLYIPREITIEYDEKTTPKEKQDMSQNLF